MSFLSNNLNILRRSIKFSSPSSNLINQNDSLSCLIKTTFSFFNNEQIRTATKRAGGSTKNNRGSAGRRLGVKKYGGEKVNTGEIIIRQRGLRFHPGQDVHLGKDHSIHASIDGYVKFYRDPTGEKVGYRSLSLRKQRMRKFVGIVSDPNQELPRDLSKEGRARYFDLVDLSQNRKNL